MTIGGVNSAIKRPLLRWHGGKYLIAPWIVAAMPAHRVYVEPFGGAASVLLRKPRAYAEVYNDLDREVVNLFRVARDRGEDLRRVLEMTPFARDEFDLSYEPTDCALEAARRMVIRSFMGFGANRKPRADGGTMRTGFRSNSNRSGTTPARDWVSYPHALAAIVDRLRGVVIENRDAVEVMTRHDGPDTLHYVDPPYPPGTRDAGPDYHHEMTDEDHRRLGQALRALKGAVMVSSYPNSLYDRMFGDWRRMERDALADGARPRREVLWLSPRAIEHGLFAGAVA